MPNKVLLVIKREYLARVKKRSFLLATLITPLVFPTILGVFLWIAMSDIQQDSLRIIEVVDDNNTFFLENNDLYMFSYGGLDRDDAKELVQKGKRYGFLYVPKLNMDRPTGITFYTEEIPGLTMISSLESNLKGKIEEQKLFA
jgi:ABC-2 type transport system permease protein